MTRRPDLSRACHQLERHGSGTSNDTPPEPVTWAEYLDNFKAAAGITMAQAMENIRAWQEAWRNGEAA